MPERRRLRLVFRTFEEIETALWSPFELSGKFLPLRRQYFRAFDDPADAFRLMIAADVRSCVTQSTDNRNHPSGTFHARDQSLIGGCIDLSANLFDQFRMAAICFQHLSKRIFL